MNKTTEALKLAEEALEELHYSSGTVKAVTLYKSALAAIRDALADHIADAGKVIAEPVKLVKLHSNGACLPFGTQLYAAPVQPVKQEPVAWMCWIDSDEEMNPANAQLTSYEPKAYAKRKPLYAAPQPITTPDVCGEVCARAKLCYGCGKALDEANAKHEPLCEDEGCPHHGTPHICFSDPSVLDKPFACEAGECPDKSLCAGACECLFKAEPVKQEVTDVLNVALEALVYHTEQTRPIHKTDEAISQIQNFLDKGATK